MTDFERELNVIRRRKTHSTEGAQRVLDILFTVERRDGVAFWAPRAQATEEVLLEMLWRHGVCLRCHRRGMALLTCRDCGWTPAGPSSRDRPGADRR